MTSLPASLARNLRLPVIAAPMFLSSGPALVVACCRAGIIGTFPALNQRTSEGLDAWLQEIRGALGACDGAASYGVNLIVHRSNPRLADDLAICTQHRVPLVITSLGAARDVVATVHGYGGLVFHDVTNSRHARKALEAGVDGLVLVAGGAGGHAGTLNPFALMGEVRRFHRGPIALAGSLSTGADILTVQALGADLAYMGTRFNATTESLAAPAYKEMLTRAGAEDIIYTDAICSVPASFLRQSLVAAGLDPARLVSPEKIEIAHVTQPYRKDLDDKPVKPWRDIWTAGQGVGTIDAVVSVADLVSVLIEQHRAARRALMARTDGAGEMSPEA
ncbi:MAG: nitronate monooxygenase [Alphaproteobacteria bacterium]|nr:nitronate monooxygenase [Alphaproteobacteria bacterium]